MFDCCKLSWPKDTYKNSKTKIEVGISLKYNAVISSLKKKKLFD